MNDSSRKAKKAGIGLFLFFLCVALVCFGIAAYIIAMKRGRAVVSKRTVEVCKIFVLTGIFFLVVDFGHLLPRLVSGKNGIFSETNMRQVLEKYIPEGETLLAGIHALSKETVIKAVFGNCVRTGNSLVSNENGGVIVHKEKHAVYDVYLGITHDSLLITECERNRWFYRFDDVPGLSGENVPGVTSEILFTDIGKCFPLADIAHCEIKKGWMGSLKCFITMKGGSHFKLLLPKFSGLGDGMPHHAEYRETIVTRLGGSNAQDKN